MALVSCRLSAVHKRQLCFNRCQVCCSKSSDNTFMNEIRAKLLKQHVFCDCRRNNVDTCIDTSPCTGGGHFSVKGRQWPGTEVTWVMSLAICRTSVSVVVRVFQLINFRMGSRAATSSKIVMPLYFGYSNEAYFSSSRFIPTISRCTLRVMLLKWRFFCVCIESEVK